jgi:hypothetical protein
MAYDKSLGTYARVLEVEIFIARLADGLDVMQTCAGPVKVTCQKRILVNAVGKVVERISTDQTAFTRFVLGSLSVIW